MVQTRMKVGKYEAWVVVENEKIEHYDVDFDEETNVATCWIASTAGKHFGVRVVKRHSKFNCVVDMYLDGSPMDVCMLYWDEKESELMNTVRVGENSVRPFLFGAVNLTDDDSVLLGQSYEELGTIKVVVYQMANYKSRSRVPASSVRLLENIKIHERAKKSATHQVMFGEMQTVSKEESPNRSVTCTRKKCVATFVFQYQSLDMLMANEIAPCDPPPVETEVPSRPVSRKRKARVTKEEEEAKPVVEISNTEDEEAKRKDEEDQRREAELEAELEKIRQGRLERKHASKRVKCEPKPVFLPGEVIDLTI